MKFYQMALVQPDGKFSGCRARVGTQTRQVVVGVLRGRKLSRELGYDNSREKRLKGAKPGESSVAARTPVSFHHILRRK